MGVLLVIPYKDTLDRFKPNKVHNKLNTSHFNKYYANLFIHHKTEYDNITKKTHVYTLAIIS